LQREIDAVLPRSLNAHAVTDYADRGGNAWWTTAAWFGFLVVNLILWTGGFPRLHQFLRRLSSTRRVTAVSQEQIVKICAGVNRAATAYLRKSWCLHRAAVTFSLLRLAGAPAQFVIGCRRLPFYSHAWVEVHGIVANDKASVKTLYAELDRF
jgi:hypothetical protein